jgi:hypothetical protein
MMVQRGKAHALIRVARGILRASRRVLGGRPCRYRRASIIESVDSCWPAQPGWGAVELRPDTPLWV